MHRCPRTRTYCSGHSISPVGQDTTLYYTYMLFRVGRATGISTPILDSQNRFRISIYDEDYIIMTIYCASRNAIRTHPTQTDEMTCNSTLRQYILYVLLFFACDSHAPCSPTKCFLPPPLLPRQLIMFTGAYDEYYNILII